MVLMAAMIYIRPMPAPTPMRALMSENSYQHPAQQLMSHPNNIYDNASKPSDAKEVIAHSIALCATILADPTFPDRRSKVWHSLYIGCPSRVQLVPGTIPARGILLNTAGFPVFHDYQRCITYIKGTPDPSDHANHATHHLFIGGDNFSNSTWIFMARTFSSAAVFWTDDPAWKNRESLEKYIPKLLHLQSLLDRLGIPSWNAPIANNRTL